MILQLQIKIQVLESPNMDFHAGQKEEDIQP